MGVTEPKRIHLASAIREKNDEPRMTTESRNPNDEESVILSEAQRSRRIPARCRERNYHEIESLASHRKHSWLRCSLDFARNDVAIFVNRHYFGDSTFKIHHFTYASAP